MNEGFLDGKRLKSKYDSCNAVKTNNMSDAEYYKCSAWNLQNIALAEA
jgi:hypothetical protein